METIKQFGIIAAYVLALILASVSVFAAWDSPTLWYPLNGSYINYGSATGNELSLTGSVNGFVPGLSGQGLNMSESGDLRNSSPAGLATGDINMSICALTYLNVNMSVEQDCLGTVGNDATRQLGIFCLNSDGRFYWRLNGDASGSYFVYNPTRRWSHFCGVYFQNNDTVSEYINGTLIQNRAATGPNALTYSGGSITLGGFELSGAQRLDGVLEDWRYYEEALTDSDILNIFEQDANITTPTYTTDLYITASDAWTGSTINNFSVNISWSNGTTTAYSSLAGNIYITNLSNGGTVYNATFWNTTGYINSANTSVNLVNSTNNTLTGSLHQAEICFNATSKVSEAAVTLDNVTINTTTRTASPFCFNVTADTHNAQGNKAGWFSQNQSFTTTPLSNTTETIANLSYANLTIFAVDGSTNESLSAYDLTILSFNYTGWTGETAAGVTNHSFYLINGTYNVTIDAPGYELTNAQANITVGGNTNYTFTLYKQNSIRITIRDEITNALINSSNITARFTNNSTTWENTTDTGYLFVYNLTPDTYTILFYGSGYSTRTYTVTVGNRSTQALTAYMISGNYSTTFTIKDADSADVLDNVSVSMYKLINSTWTVVESKYSDVSGRALFYYDPIGSYKFYLSKPDYTDYVFFLDPILFSSYDVYMSKTSLLNASEDFEGLALIYAPQSFPNNNATTFNFILSSPDGLLTEYGINLTFPTGGQVNATGYNAIGSQLSVVVNVTNATAYDTVRLDYYYITTTQGRRNFTAYFPIEFNTSAGDLTFLSNKNKTYGLGIFERILIITLVVLFIVGIATLVGQPIPGLGLGLFTFGYMAYIGFVPLWAILPSMFIGVLFLVWKSGGY